MSHADMMMYVLTRMTVVEHIQWEVYMTLLVLLILFLLKDSYVAVCDNNNNSRRTKAFWHELLHVVNSCSSIILCFMT